MTELHHTEDNIHKIYEKYKYLLSIKPPPKDEDICLYELGFLVRDFEGFFFSDTSSTCNRGNVLVALVELVTSFGLVRKFEGCEDRDLDASDFPYEARNAELCFQYLNCLLDEYENVDTSSKRKFLVQVLLLCATHNQKYVWSSEMCVSLSEAFLQNLLLATKYTSLSMLLIDDTFHPTIFKAVLRWMRPMLMKNTWMKHACSYHVFFWFLCYVKHPHLADYLSDILPPPFMFSSYYAIPQQVIGIKAFHHILCNVPPSLVTADGTEEAIFDHLKRYQYSNEKPVIQVIYKCILKLPMMNSQKVNQLQWLKYDVVLHQLLQNVTMESDPEMRYLFLSELFLFIAERPSFKHLKKILNVLYGNFTNNSIEEEKCRSLALQILKELIRNCWPRMKWHCFNIMVSILKISSDIPKCDKESDVLTLCQECLSILKSSCPEEFKALADDYMQENNLLPGCRLLREL